MELPRKILVGDNVISELGNFITDINNRISSVVIISGETVRNKIEDNIIKSFKKSHISNYWFTRKDASFETVSRIKIEIEELKPDNERGYYLHPELYNQPEERNLMRLRYPAPITSQQ